MEKITAKQLKSLRSASVLALALLFLSMNLKKSDCLSAAAANVEAECNATVVGDCLPGDEEFMMDSEISRMLATRSSQTITVPALNPKRPYCNRNVYGSCTPRNDVPYKVRKCNYANGCGRPGY